jgi:hypothetical protein
MKIHRPSKLKVVSLVVVFALALVMAQPRPAHAWCIDPYSCAAILGLAVTAIAVVVTVKTAICTPVAAFKASDHPNGFTGAFKDCWKPEQKQTVAPVERIAAEPTADEPEELTQPTFDSTPADEASESPAQ